MVVDFSISNFYCEIGNTDWLLFSFSSQWVDFSRIREDIRKIGCLNSEFRDRFFQKARVFQKSWMKKFPYKLLQKFRKNINFWVIPVPSQTLMLWFRVFQVFVSEFHLLSLWRSPRSPEFLKAWNSIDSISIGNLSGISQVYPLRSL